MAALTPEERDSAVAELESSRRRLLAALDGLNAENWSGRPDGGGWSIAECAEHVVAAELPIPRFFASPAMVEVSDEQRREVRGKDDFVRRFLRDRSQRDEAPERIRPRGRFVTREETIRVFEERREANLAWLRETSDSLRDRFAPHPFAGMIDGYQWVLFLAAHTDRHAAQIEEIRAGLGL